jgi:hypothetical protein
MGISTMLKNACGSLLYLILLWKVSTRFLVVYMHYSLYRRNMAPTCESVKAAQDYPDAMANFLTKPKGLYIDGKKVVVAIRRTDILHFLSISIIGDMLNRRNA